MNYSERLSKAKAAFIEHRSRGRHHYAAEFTKHLKKWIKSQGVGTILKYIKETLSAPWLPKSWYQKKSTIVTNQLLVTHWHEHLNDATLANAILDRLIHNSIRIELKGPSMRKELKTLLNEEE